MNQFYAHKTITQTEKQFREIITLYNHLKSDTNVMSSTQINSQIRKILQRINKIDLKLIDECLESLKRSLIYDQTKEKIDSHLSTMDEIKKYVYSLQNQDEEEDEEDVNMPENKKIKLIKDKYAFLQKSAATSNTSSVIKDAKRLENLISRINFEDLPEGDYEELLHIKNDVSNIIETYIGIEKSEKYGPYIMEPLMELLEKTKTLGSKQKSEQRAAWLLNFIEDPKNINMFEPAIKRIIARKMTIKEFNTFYDSVVSMINSRKQFESFNNYKNKYNYVYSI
jgi:hypothetical protein